MNSFPGKNSARTNPAIRPSVILEQRFPLALCDGVDIVRVIDLPVVGVSMTSAVLLTLERSGTVPGGNARPLPSRRHARKTPSFERGQSTPGEEVENEAIDPVGISYRGDWFFMGVADHEDRGASVRQRGSLCAVQGGTGERPAAPTRGGDREGFERWHKRTVQHDAAQPSNGRASFRAL